MPFRISIRLAAASLGLTLAACHQAEAPQTVLAQVDQSRLTLEEVRESFPPEMEKVLTREQYLAFLQQWAEDEVIFQQALKSKLDGNPKVARKLKDIRRKVLIEEFMAREGAAQEYEPDEGAVARYYEMRKEAFRRLAPEFRYAQIRVGSLKEAQAVRAQIRGENFLAIAARSSLDPAAEFPAARPFRKAGEIPACLLRDLAEARPGFMSGPLACPDGYYLVKLLDRVEAGTPVSLAEAKDAIASQLAMEHKDKMRAAKIRQYKEGAAISFNLDFLPGVEPNAGNAEPEETASAAAPSVAGSAPPSEAKTQPAETPAPKKPAPPAPRKRRAPPARPAAPAPASLAAEPATPAPAETEPTPPAGNDHAPSDTSH